jgi:pyrroline-5-carboxylate reductase
MVRPEIEPVWPDRLLFVGCGNMGGAMLARWLECGLPPYRVQVLRPSGEPVADGIEVLTSLDGQVIAGTHVILACKPQQLPEVARALRPHLAHGPRLISILAGVTLAQLREAFPEASVILRCMPNLPVRHGRGVCLMKGDERLQASSRARASGIFGALGLVEWLEDETLFDAATALSGCGPAFVYRFIDALAAAGAEIGLDPAMAARMALATVSGAGVSAALSPQSPADMADAVASKGGMTREGLDVLDRDQALERLLVETLRAARDRGKALAALARAKEQAEG